MVQMPAIIIRDECQRRVANLSFAGQFCLLEVSHPDHIHAPRAVDVRLGFRRERRALHAEIGSTAMNLTLRGGAGFFKHISQSITYWMGKRHMRHHALPKESRFKCACPSTIEELIG